MGKTNTSHSFVRILAVGLVLVLLSACGGAATTGTPGNSSSSSSSSSSSGGAPLASSMLVKIYNWIAHGAQNN